MKGTIKVVNATGHSTVEFDTTVAASVEVANETIKRAIDMRSKLFDGTTKEEIPPKDWKPEEHEETLVIPPMAGGA
jgi:hypothetical protein